MTERDGLRLLVDHLAEGASCHLTRFYGWQVTSIRGGANNLIYRATDTTRDLAVKFTLRDERSRAEREFLALSALRQLSLHLSPAPVWLETERHSYPVVVQEWLKGEVLTAPPQTDVAWGRLLYFYTKVHSVTPAMTHLPIREAVFGATSPEEAKQLVLAQADLIPQRARPTDLRALLKALVSARIPDLNGRRALCHVDPNVGNFVVCSEGLRAVDWEGSGWSDPAFEVANLMTHPAYLSITRTSWEWVVDTYAHLSRDGDVEARIRAYYPLLAIFWVTRLARALYEVPRGLDQRLVQRPDNWQEDAARKYQHYLELAESSL